MPERPFVKWLIDRCDQVARLERDAGSALQIADDPELYRRIMWQKALLLESLYEDAQPLLPSLRGDQMRIAADRLRRFSESAARALELESVFYMSALLFPENHAAGEANDLEAFLAEVMQWPGTGREEQRVCPK